MRSPIILLAFVLLGLSHCAQAQSLAIAPDVFATARQAADGLLLQGVSLRIAVRLESPREATVPILLAPTAGTWADAVIVELVDASSGKSLARAEMVGKPDASTATLVARQVAGGLWRFPPQVTASLAAGPYRVHTRLAIRSGTGWTGEAPSRDIAITLIAANDPVFSDEERVLARAAADFHDGQLPAAAARLDAWLMSNAASIDVLVLRARVAELAGDLAIAIACARIAEVLEKGVIPEARPSEAFELSQRLAGKIHLDDPKLGYSPASLWAWPPHSKVLALLNPPRP